MPTFDQWLARKYPDLATVTEIKDVPNDVTGKVPVGLNLRCESNAAD